MGASPMRYDVRLWNLIDCAGGATGILYPRWRPLLDGPLFGAFAPFAMDGSVTPRAEMTGKVAKWANGHPEIWRSRPVKGDIGLVFVPESEMFDYVQRGNTNQYAQSIRGAYQGFFDNNIQADFVHIDNIKEYPAVYLPYPIMLKADSAEKLTDYVRNGGILISEGLPGYFGEHGTVGTVQPNYGLDQVFGARESYVEFTPDLLDNLTLKVLDWQIYGRYFLQTYATAGGTVAGNYEDGRVAAVEHQFGKGKALLIGTFPGGGYYLHHSAAEKAFFAGLLKWAQIAPRLSSNAPGTQARLHSGAGGTYLYVVNPDRAPHAVAVTIGSGTPAFTAGDDLWGGQKVEVNGKVVQVTTGERDAAVIRLQ